MSKHVTPWLSAYHDGELHGVGLRRVEQHLAECPQCRAELEELRMLSVLLRQTPPAVNFLRPERFVARLVLQLPRRTSLVVEFGWWLVPFGTLAVWLFAQVTSWLRAVFLLGLDAGLLTNLLEFPSTSLQMNWFTALTSLLGNHLNPFVQAGLSILNNLHVLVVRWQSNLLFEAILIVVYLAWLMVCMARCSSRLRTA
ncbi:MAG: hypothetical protein DDG60_14970 [Anaerolineae bacterium]|nr:MAG: hypothetical protein DDG60_14970 [Anaerolineae bacterium]